MALTIEILPGPLTSQMTRSDAERALRKHASFPKGASLQLEQLDGRWVAAIVHQAGPPFGGAPADSDEESAGPKSEGPDDTAPSPDGGDEGPPSPDSDSGDSGGPPKHDKGKGGESHELSMLMDLVSQIAQALGLPVGMGDSMVPGMDDGMGGPPGGPPGMGGPPPGGHGGPPGGPGAGGPPPPPHGGPGGPMMAGKGKGQPQVTIHQRAMKPGETPPGGTPIGAPAFSHVNPDHPWAHVAGQVASFEVAERIGNTPLTDVEADLQQLAATSGYKVSRFTEGRDNEGYRIARAVISVH